MGVCITGIGHYVPPRIVTNAELSRLVDTSDEWIRARTGIEERRFAADDQATSDLAREASMAALRNAGRAPADIDCIILATLSPDHQFPGTSVYLQVKLGIPGIPAMDVHTQCSGFLYALSTARALVESRAYQRVLVVGAELQSKGLDFSNEGRDMAVLFGDGAAAVICEWNTDRNMIVDIELGADGRFAHELCGLAPGSAFPRWRVNETIQRERKDLPYMNGRAVFQAATTKMAELAARMIQKHGLTEKDVSLVICHQANRRIIEYVHKILGWDPKKFFVNINRYGNTTSASIPIALSEAREQKIIGDGSRVIMIAFGSGFTWGSGLIQF